MFHDYAVLSQEAIEAGGNEYVVIQDLSAQFEKSITNIVPSLSTFPHEGRVRAADMNIDGFPDLFLTLEFQSTGKSNAKSNQSFVLLSAACTPGQCPKAAADHTEYSLKLPRRFFKVNFEDAGFDSEKITSLAGASAVMLVPMDVDDDGRIDVLVQRCAVVTASSGVAQRTCHLSAIYNNIIFDSFFIKAMMLS